MRLILYRSGGFAGVRRPPIVIDTQTLAPEHAALVERLIAAAEGFAASRQVSGLTQPDRFEYTIELVAGQGPPRSFTITEADAPAALLELIRLIQELGKRRKDTTE